MPPGDGRTAHEDRFVLDNLPPRELWPAFDFSNIPNGITYPDRLNCARELLDGAIESGFEDKTVLQYGGTEWTYGGLRARADAIARYLTEACDFVPGNRVLLRGPNTPMLVACWFGVVKAGGICVATMPLLRQAELSVIVEKVEARIAFCDVAVAAELAATAQNSRYLARVHYFTDTGDGADAQGDLDRTLAAYAGNFEAVDTAADDPLFVAFTSGTTGEPKGAVHFHRDAMAITDCFPRDVWDVKPEHVFSGTPPLAFTYGLGALALIPMRFGASSVLVPAPTPDALLAAIETHKVSDLYTAPTMYRRMMSDLGGHDISSLKRCNSAGEHLPLETLKQWRNSTGLVIVDQIGSTELLHNFMAASGDEQSWGTTGRPVQGYTAKLVGSNGASLKTGEIGHLAVRGPVGCLYLANEARQREYVRDGWNVTGDLFSQDEHGNYCYVGRTDDLIVSSGYNIAAVEVEQVLLAHDRVSECAVVGVDDIDRGQIVKAFIVPVAPVDNQQRLAKELQDYVKGAIAPYKYPRMIEFIDGLPQTATGKIQRHKLRDAN
jgi:2-aminobenzoate-CoA ligase